MAKRLKIDRNQPFFLRFYPFSPIFFRYFPKNFIQTTAKRTNFNINVNFSHNHSLIFPLCVPSFRFFTISQVKSFLSSNVTFLTLKLYQKVSLTGQKHTQKPALSLSFRGTNLKKLFFIPVISPKNRISTPNDRFESKFDDKN